MDINLLVKEALREDLGRRDITSQVIFPKSRVARGIFLAKEDLVLAGGPVVKKVFQALDHRVRFKTLKKEGELVKRGQTIAEVYGDIQVLLAGERVALNFLTHLSGVATLTHQFVQKVKETRAKILETRKTTPGFRELEKYAVRMGGGKNHRMGLYDAILVKDNHIAAAGGIRPAFEAIKKAKPGSAIFGRGSLFLSKSAPRVAKLTQNSTTGRNPKAKFIEFEVKNLAELKEALDLGIKRILLDNFRLDQIKEAVKIAKGRALLEVSGGVNLKNVRAIAKTGVDFISVGALTHSAPSVDISFETTIIQ